MCNNSWGWLGNLGREGLFSPKEYQLRGSESHHPFLKADGVDVPPPASSTPAGGALRGDRWALQLADGVYLSTLNGAHLFAENMQSAERANERQGQTAERLFWRSLPQTTLLWGRWTCRPAVTHTWKPFRWEGCHFIYLCSVRNEGGRSNKPESPQKYLYTEAHVHMNLIENSGAGGDHQPWSSVFAISPARWWWRECAAPVINVAVRYAISAT